MSDGTLVSIEIRSRDYERLLNDEFEGDRKALRETIWAGSIISMGNLVLLERDEVDSAEWDILEDILNEHQIDYDKSWGAGQEYQAGRKSIRFINGEKKSIEIEDDAVLLLDFLKNVKCLAPEEIKQRVQDKYAELRPFEIFPLESGPTQTASLTSTLDANTSLPQASALLEDLETVFALAERDIADSQRIAETPEEIKEIESHQKALERVRNGLSLLTAAWANLEENADAKDKITASVTVSEVAAKRGGGKEQKRSPKVRHAVSPG